MLPVAGVPRLPWPRVMQRSQRCVVPCSGVATRRAFRTPWAVLSSPALGLTAFIGGLMAVVADARPTLIFSPKSQRVPRQLQIDSQRPIKLRFLHQKPKDATPPCAYACVFGILWVFDPENAVLQGQGCQPPLSPHYRAERLCRRFSTPPVSLPPLPHPNRSSITP
jgi:hypothetical protein